MDRYRLYFLLMDVATFFVVASLVQFVVDPPKLQPGVEENIWHSIIGWPALLLPPFLILARFMRDEFAQACWQRAAAVTVAGLVVLPLVAIFGWSAVQAMLGLQRGALFGAISGAFMFMIVWSSLITLFVLAFQFFRWRGAR
jgi:hypothetical protein